MIDLVIASVIAIVVDAQPMEPRWLFDYSIHPYHEIRQTGQPAISVDFVALRESRSYRVKFPMVEEDNRNSSFP